MKTYSSRALRAIILHYRNYRQQYPDTQLSHCQSQPGFSALVEMAARGINHIGKLHQHQYRQGYAKMNDWAKHLASFSGYLKKASDFDTLYNRLFELRHSGISHLTVYDTAHRIASHHTVNKPPKKVYLHTGSAIGAEQLVGSKAKNQSFLSIEDFPAEFHQLSASDIEDILCIYEGQWLTGPENSIGCSPTSKSKRIC